MNKKLIIPAVLLATVVMPFHIAVAADQSSTQSQAQTQSQIYGSQLMTNQERTTYHNEMRKAKSEQEREQIRNQHHEQMQIRAKERGVTLPDMPPAMGGGMGPGMGGGMGPGGGKAGR
jgi:sensor c-di-GMP phosphodiesterase-like protein